ncbi:MAG: FkbM family methyltransferase [Sulfuricurvum sp.]
METLVKSESILHDVITVLPEINQYHSVNSNLYKFLNKIVISEIETIYSKVNQFNFSVFGKIEIPYISFGAINTKDLFGLDEFIIFSYYDKMRGKYNTAIDLGANIGLHSVLMSKCFHTVISFEPDDYHFSILSDVIEKNNTSNVILNKMAISSIEGELEFTRVKGNTTGSHISGSKQLVYGETDKFNVQCTTLEAVINKYKPDFIKMDIEGQEKDVLLATSIDALKNIDMIIEVSSEKNAEELFNYFKNSGINLFSQKTNWKKVECKEDMPYSYKHGSLFISTKAKMDWN